MKKVFFSISKKILKTLGKIGAVKIWPSYILIYEDAPYFSKNLKMIWGTKNFFQ